MPEYATSDTPPLPPAVVRLTGDLDVESSGDLREALLGALDRSSTVVADLGGVQFMDSTGLGVLVGALKRCRAAGGDLVLRNPNAPLRKTMRVTGLDRVFTVVGPDGDD